MLYRRAKADERIEIECPRLGLSCFVALSGVQLNARGKVTSYTLAIDGSPEEFVIPIKRREDAATRN